MPIYGAARRGQRDRLRRMQTVAWQGVGNDSKHPLGDRSKARTEALAGTAGQAPSDPA
jgi:hypothetical protein